MDEYKQLKMWKLRPITEVDTSVYKIYDVLWTGTIKFDKNLVFEKLNPRVSA